MESSDFLAALAPALTDADARQHFLAEPRVVLTRAGLALPEWLQITASEGESAQILISLPPLLDSDEELVEEHLAAVSGGCCGHCGSTKCDV